MTEKYNEEYLVNFIKLYRIENHLSQFKLSFISNVSQAHLSKLENKKLVNNTIIYDIVKSLNISLPHSNDDKLCYIENLFNNLYISILLNLKNKASIDYEKIKSQ